MPVRPLKAFNDNYIWSISYKDNLMVFDPGMAEPVITYAEQHNLNVSDILITHHHFDHTGGIEEIIKKFPFVNIYAPDDNRIKNVSTKLKDNEQIEINGHRFKVLFTPGHTISHICYFEPQKHWLFSGDTLFSAGCGRLFEGSIEDLYESLNLLKNLPATTKLFAGHEYTRKNLEFAKTIEPNNPVIIAHINFLKQNSDICSLPSTIALEKEINPFLRTDSTEIRKFAKEHKIEDNDISILKELRKLKDNF